MIVTKKWLQEWIDLCDVSVDEICEKLNSIGLEVDSVNELRIPSKVVVAKVLSCEKHPDADKLNVCKVDIGSKVTQIVCGAKNVADGQYVCAALPGADLGNGFVIKEAKLRGVESNGMICGADEIGLPKMNEGILILDESIGELELGKELCEYELLNDTIIDIELTANRGDCQSVRGIARDLAAAFERELLEYESVFKSVSLNEKSIEFHAEEDVKCSLLYKIAYINECRGGLIEAFRLACVDKYSDDPFSQVLKYSMHSTGVILRAYDFKKCADINAHAVISLKKDKNGVPCVYHEDKLLSVVGLNQSDESKFTGGQSVILEASYIDPSLVSELKMTRKIEADDLFYNTSRGSESDLSLGMGYVCDAMSDFCNVLIDEKEYSYDFGEDAKRLEIEPNYIENFIGYRIELNVIESILRRLGFGCEFVDEKIKVTIPKFRADIEHSQDIVEEIVRIVGIDNIKSKPLEFVEKRRLNKIYDLYKKRIKYRQKAAGSGFFESVHYFFDNKELMRKFGIDTLDDELDLLNPITAELNTLRTTLVLNLIKSASYNIKNSYKSVRLFELGSVVDAKRDQSEKMAFIFCGQIEDAFVSNHGKPEDINFFAFCRKISSVIGKFELRKSEDNKALLSPYEQAKIIIDKEEIGFIARVHADVEREFDLPKTYVCEVDFKSLRSGIIEAENYSKFPSLNRDLSLLVPKRFSFGDIKEKLNTLLPKEIKSFYPIDIYESEELGDSVSLTVRFEMGSDEKTLKEDEITSLMQNILEVLKENFNIGIR